MKKLLVCSIVALLVFPNSGYVFADSRADSLGEYVNSSTTIESVPSIPASSKWVVKKYLVSRVIDKVKYSEDRHRKVIYTQEKYAVYQESAGATGVRYHLYDEYKTWWSGYEYNKSKKKWVPVPGYQNKYEFSRDRGPFIDLLGALL